MCPDARALPAIPVETIQAVRRVYNGQHIYVRIGDELDRVQARTNLTLLDSTSSQNPDALLRLALVTAFQYAEDLPDSAASVATMKRLDWKYALHMPMKHPGFDQSALCRFRKNLIPSQSGLKEYSLFLGELSNLGLFAWAASSGPLDASEALSTVCMTSRLSKLKLQMKSVLGALVTAAPEWVRANALPYWYHRYSTASLAHPSRPDPTLLIGEANLIGTDIYRLLKILPQAETLDQVCQAEIRALSQQWEEEFTMDGNLIRWQLPGCSKCACNQLGEMDL